MGLLHKTAFGLYDLSWRIALPWLKLNQRLAQGYHQRVLKVGLPDAADLWIQAASVGESFLALEILKILRVKRPTQTLLTSNTRQGVDILNQSLPDQLGDRNQIQTAVRFFPFDKPSIMAAAVAGIRPKLAVLLETEIWPGLLLALKNQNCKIIIINGRITEKSLRRYNLWPSIWQSLRPDKVLAVSPADADRFGRLFGQDGIEIMPNIKFDRIASTTGSDPAEDVIKTLLPPAVSFVILASVRQPEEPLVKKIVQAVIGNRPQTVIGLFPRHMQRLGYWQKTLDETGIRWSLRSEIETRVPAGSVVLWDTFGELLPAYRHANTAFIGGSLVPLGGQNFLEALVNGVLPVIGPSWENFAWVGSEIIESGLLRIAEDWSNVVDLLLKDINSPVHRQDVMTAALHYIKARQGGTQIACRHIAHSLENEQTKK
ncbi:MAG: glycosyltransferase N-terminal domain-containing protein [Desulfobacteraceae bacterium]|jgi:3-deoxy-D-manno-octulosonic-acid transferase|nr:glycosyltransferase N-terminal domain-containing protein [Desulfobacteraceae bacterium]